MELIVQKEAALLDFLNDFEIWTSRCGHVMRTGPVCKVKLPDLKKCKTRRAIIDAVMVVLNAIGCTYLTEIPDEEMKKFALRRYLIKFRITCMP
jgi:hypothetical protein